MIDDKCMKYLTELYGDFDYRKRLLDFTNEDIRKALKGGHIEDKFQLFRILSETVTDPEARAHVLGFESARARANLIAEIAAKQAKLKD